MGTGDRRLVRLVGAVMLGLALGYWLHVATLPYIVHAPYAPGLMAGV